MTTETGKNELAVVHLIWMPFGIAVFRSFIQSYLEHPAGCGHDLVLVFSGIGREEEAAAYHEYLREKNVAYISYYLAGGQDIEAYYFVASRLQQHYILFLNSYSCILADRWGVHFLDAVRNEGVGAVAATGSWQSYYSTVFMRERVAWVYEKGEMTPFRKIKLFIKNIFYWRVLFKPFPNPHLRTNAFIVERTLWLSIRRPASFPTKFTAYVFESGRRGFSGQLMRRGLQLLVVDRTGITYPATAWRDSRTFWWERQERLMVSDNQTRKYAEGTSEFQRKLTYLAWGIK
jgi:hypothetical protein